MGRKNRGRGEGSIYRAKDGTWKGDVTLGWKDNGVRRHKVVSGPTKAVVLEKMDEVRRQFQMGGLRQNILTVGEGLDIWMASIRGQIEPTTWNRREELVRLYLKPFLGHTKVDRVEAVTVLSWYNWLDGHSGPGTKRMAAQALRLFLDRAVVMGMIGVNPSRRIPLPRKPDFTAQTWNPDQLRTFLAVARSHRLYPLFLLALDTGLRQGELLALEWPDIDLDHRLLTVTKSVGRSRGEGWRVKAPKTRAGRRTVGITVQTAEALRISRPVDGTGLVFPNKRKTGYIKRESLLGQVWKPLVQKAGVPYIRFHDLRHLSATYLLAAGENPKVVQERLGHAHVQTTLDTYSHYLPHMQEGAVDRMTAFLESVGVPKKYRESSVEPVNPEGYKSEDFNG